MCVHVMASPDHGIPSNNLWSYSHQLLSAELISGLRDYRYRTWELSNHAHAGRPPLDLSHLVIAHLVPFLTCTHQGREPAGT